jgi:hypothetical protein
MKQQNLLTARGCFIMALHPVAVFATPPTLARRPRGYSRIKGFPPLIACILSRAFVPGPLSLGLCVLSFGAVGQASSYAFLCIMHWKQLSLFQKTARKLNQVISIALGLARGLI